MITNGIGYDSWPIPSVKAMCAAAPLLAKVPAVALKPALGVLLARGHDSAAQAKEALGVHYAPYAEHGGGAAMARQVSALDVRDTLAVQEALPTLGVPARIVWGAADPFQKVEYGERFARDLGTTVQRIDGGKHFTPRTTLTSSPRRSAFCTTRPPADDERLYLPLSAGERMIEA